MILNFNEIILKIIKNDDNNHGLEIENELKKEIQEKFEKNKSFNNLQKNEQESVLQAIILLGTQNLKAKLDSFNQEIEDKDLVTRIKDSIYFLNDWNSFIIDLVVLQKNKDLFNLLIKLELNENDKNEKRCLKALHFAIINNDLDMVQKLLNYPKIKIDKRDSLFFSTSLSKATSSNNLTICKLLLEKDNSSINCPDKWYRLSLHYASKNGNLEIVKLLLDNGAYFYL